MNPRKELEKERNVVIEEISKTKDSPGSRAFDNIFKLIYEKSNHPYKRTVIGSKDIIETVTREEILNYFNRFYTPDAYTTVIVGDVDKIDTLKKVAEAFKQTKRKQEIVKYPSVKSLNGIERAYDTMDINKNHTIMAFMAPKVKDVQPNYALDVLSTMLTSGKSSILNQNLKENKELVLSVSSGNYSQKDSGMFYIYAIYEPNNEDKIESAIVEELKNIQEGKFNDNLISKAKNQIKTDTYYSRESISNISDDLGYTYTFINDLNYYENYLKNIDKVTKEDVIKAAKKYLTLDKYALSTIRANNCKPVNTVIQEEKTQTPKLIQEVNNTKKVLLQNGATLITKKKKTNSIIAIDIAIKGSKAIEKKPVTAMLTALSATTGSTNYTNSQFAQFLDENGIKLGVTSGNDTFSIVIQTTKDNLAKALIALNEVINNPTFQDVEINKIKQSKIQELKSVSDSPSSFVFDEFKKLAFKDSIYGQNSTFILNNINNVKRDDIVEFYSRIINPENMSIAVVGDVDDKYISSELNKIIKPNNKSQKFQFSNQKFNAYKPQENIETTLYKKEVQANWMALGYKTCGNLNRRDVAILSVINAILGEGMSSRLFVSLRENKGLAYTVGSSLSINVLDGAFVTYIGTNKNSVKEAKQGLMDEINRIKKEPVTNKELQYAKDKIMGKFLLGIETNMDEAELLSHYSVIGRDLNAFEEYKKAINNVSQNDILEIANKYFSTPHIYTVVMEK